MTSKIQKRLLLPHRPCRTELLEETDLEEPDPAVYDHLTTLEEAPAHE